MFKSLNQTEKHKKLLKTLFQIKIQRVQFRVTVQHNKIRQHNKYNVGMA